MPFLQLRYFTFADVIPRYGYCKSGFAYSDLGKCMTILHYYDERYSKEDVCGTADAIPTTNPSVVFSAYDTFHDFWDSKLENNNLNLDSYHIYSSVESSRVNVISRLRSRSSPLLLTQLKLDHRSMSLTILQSKK